MTAKNSMEKFGIKRDGHLLAMLPSIKVFPNLTIEKTKEAVDDIGELKEFFNNLRQYSTEYQDDIRVRADMLTLLGVLVKIYTRNKGVLETNEQATVESIYLRYLNKEFFTKKMKFNEPF